jgi:hypothetical protein
MNDPRHPVQPAPAAPGMPRPTPIAPPPQQQQQPRPMGAPTAHPTHAHPAHAPQPARPAGVGGAPAHQQQPQQRPMQSPQPQVVRPMQSPTPGGTPPMPARHAPQPVPADEEAIALEDADDDGDGDLLAAPTTPSKIKFGAELGIKKHAWKREPVRTGTGACRVRTFHGKLSDQGLEYIDEAINVWLDEHPEIDIKFVTTNVGMFDGKFKDLALVVNVWY